MKDKLHFVMGSGLALKCLWDFVMQTDFVKQVPRLEIPVYIFQGRFDYQVSYSLAKEFADTVKAPVKGFYTFENSAHSPCFEEPKKMCRIIREDVFAGKMRFGGWIKLEMSQKTLFYKEKVVDTSGRV